ncbi:hypothetical protein Tco_0522758 [Tanacetum coccineum]
MVQFFLEQYFTKKDLPGIPPAPLLSGVVDDMDLVHIGLHYAPHSTGYLSIRYFTLPTELRILIWQPEEDGNLSRCEDYQGNLISKHKLTVENLSTRSYYRIEQEDEGTYKEHLKLIFRIALKKEELYGAKFSLIPCNAFRQRALAQLCLCKDASGLIAYALRQLGKNSMEKKKLWTHDLGNLEAVKCSSKEFGRGHYLLERRREARRDREVGTLENIIDQNVGGYVD